MCPDLLLVNLDLFPSLFLFHWKRGITLLDAHSRGGSFGEMQQGLQSLFRALRSVTTLQGEETLSSRSADSG
jgi:hypothetical protein